MQEIERRRSTLTVCGKEALSYTVTSRELVWQVPTAAQSLAASLGRP
ncbi:MAG: hypothetical protein PHV32_17665 [Eubacteriales bacterium]|nr:hypothetical protein [Eubacteriales bacterium]